MSLKDGVEDLGQFLLCTSCTISYMFGTPKTTVTPETIAFREHPDTYIEVAFENRTLEFTKATNLGIYNAGETFKVTMEIGIIDPKYKDNFNWPN